MNTPSPLYGGEARDVHARRMRARIADFLAVRAGVSVVADIIVDDRGVPAKMVRLRPVWSPCNSKTGEAGAIFSDRHRICSDARRGTFTHTLSVVAWRTGLLPLIIKWQKAAACVAVTREHLKLVAGFPVPAPSSTSSKRHHHASITVAGTPEAFGETLPSRWKEPLLSSISERHP